MNRRDFLKRLTAAAVGTGLVLPAALESALPEIIIPNVTFPLPGMQETFRLVFPDGDVWTFDGIVTALLRQDSADGPASVEMSVRPTGTPIKSREDYTRIRTEDVNTQFFMQNNAGAFDEIGSINDIHFETSAVQVDVTSRDGWSASVPGQRRMEIKIFGRVDEA